MKIHGMCLIKDEANVKRWLEPFLKQMTDICDNVIVLDDASKDLTPFICEDYGCKVYRSEKSLWEIDELHQRELLWEKTIENAEIGDWILCLDADELFVPEHIEYIKFLLKSMGRFDVNGIAFRLYDMWSKTHYREDKLWTAHLRAWPMCVKLQDIEYKWQNKKLHCGRFPMNAALKCVQSWIPIKHMGWSKSEFRQKKYEKYMKIDPEGKNGILEQYESIIDLDPPLFEF